ncbi:uncharacterized protein LOC122714842 [Apis laboriosa]|uniref:uncharacterized protein LOC122714842 n=1 Tax=Apis laboriosa TaxID=183418 RepID=UPI001CC57636|nr:uncharacterized protein LOC122714842 [Apis laboriosa]
MDRRGIFSISIFCLLIALTVATVTRPEKASLGTAAVINPERRNASSVISLEDDGVAVGSRVERIENEEQEEDYEGEDEYEDELKAVAESHEAMSRDDIRNSNVSAAPSTPGIPDRISSPTKNFDSREVIAVNNSSDEDVASNEAITDEIVDKYDQEVVELVKYKKERNRNHGEDNRTKTKRVPTVKKELSTQKEILIGSRNESQVSKSVPPSEEGVNRLNEELEPIRRRNVVESSEPAKSERSRGEDEIVADDDRYSSRSDARKLDKRQETTLKDLKSYLLAGYATKQKLRKLGTREDALLDDLLQLLMKLAEDPRRWERLHKLLVNRENELKLSRDELEPDKRSYQPTLNLFSTESTNESRKSRKKSKKKKKKPKHRLSTTPLTSVPATPPLLTTTEIPWQTTPVQWRLIAERLFGPPWEQDVHGETEQGTSHSSPQSPRSLASIRDLIEEDKSNGKPKTFPSDRKPILANQVGELGNQRLMRFGKIGNRQPGHVQQRREFASVYDRPIDPERMPDYDIPETYHRPRYDQLSPARELVRGREEEDDYRGDFNVQSDGYPIDREYEQRDFRLSKSWPDLSYGGYDPPWRTQEERPPLPLTSEKWSWRQPANKYWPHRVNFPPVEKNYWSAFRSQDEEEEEEEEDARNEKTWQQQRNVHRSWNTRDRSSWPAEKALKPVSSWQQAVETRPAKPYEGKKGVWEKSKNRSEASKSAKEEGGEKVGRPQITMKTWNSLTSDPATWPHKLPGAKPWPKDENGKSYNPNADLVKKLGLDKQQNGGPWSSEGKEGSGEKEGRKEGEEAPSFSSAAYKSSDEYKGDSMKSSWPNEWAKKVESMQGDDSNAWRRKYEGKKNAWRADEAALPKIQSVGAWVMAADQSTWKPYQIKPMVSDETGPRRWSAKPLNGRSGKKASWTEKSNENSWMDRSDDDLSLWPEPINADPWPEKSSKPWYADTRDLDGWPSTGGKPPGKATDSWKVKGEEWLAKNPESSASSSSSSSSSSWISKIQGGGEKSSWAGRGVGGSWSSNESWNESKTSEDASKFAGDSSWPVAKAKEEEPSDGWARKPGERTGWKSPNDLWQQKMSEEWGYGKTSSTGTWPAKWKQFAYHRVTAVPISKPGTTADAASSKSRNNAFVAVSAVSSPKYGGNEWRRNEEDARNENERRGGEEQERSGNQVQVGLERPIYAWKKDAGKGNGTDPLENQLEALRQIDFWSYKENEAEKRLTSTRATTETTSSTPKNNSTTATMHRRGPLITENGNGLLETNRRTISMK